MSLVCSWNEVGDVLCQVSSSPFCTRPFWRTRGELLAENLPIFILSFPGRMAAINFTKTSTSSIRDVTKFFHREIPGVGGPKQCRDTFWNCKPKNRGESPKIGKLFRRGCKRCFGRQGAKVSQESLLHHPSSVSRQCNPNLHLCKRLFGSWMLLQRAD